MLLKKINPHLASTFDAFIRMTEKVFSWWEKRTSTKRTHREGPDKEASYNSKTSNQDTMDKELTSFTSGLEAETCNQRILVPKMSYFIAENEIRAGPFILPERTTRSPISKIEDANRISVTRKTKLMYTVRPLDNMAAAISIYGKDLFSKRDGYDGWTLHDFLHDFIYNYVYPCKYNGRRMKHNTSFSYRYRRAGRHRRKTTYILQRRGIITSALLDCYREVDLEQISSNCGNQSRRQRKTGDRKRKVSTTLQRRGNLTTALLGCDREKYSEHNLAKSRNQLQRQRKIGNRTRKKGTNTLQRRGCISTALIGYDGDIYSGSFWKVQDSRCFTPLTRSHHSLAVFVD